LKIDFHDLKSLCLRNPLFLCYNAAVKVLSRKKGLILFFSLFVPLVFFSCSGSQGLETANFDKESLRGIALEKELGTLWTRELESVRLLQETSEIPEIAKGIRLEPRVAASAEFTGDYIFPYISGFGSLDTAGISKELSEFLEKFCADVSVWRISEDFFSKDSLFSLILFKNDMEKSWKDVFSTDFPVQGLNENKDRDEKSAESQKVFISYVYGAPFVEDGGVFVPVRFYAKSGIADVALFIDINGETPENSEIKIRQIQIIKREILPNGK